MLSLVLKVSTSGEDHGHADFVACGNDIIIVLRAARLNDRRDTGFRRFVNRIREREEGVGR